MTTEFKPNVLGTPGVDITAMDPAVEIKNMEDERKEMARSLR